MTGPFKSQDIYPTRIYTATLPGHEAINEVLREQILQLREQDTQNKSRSLKNGWQSHRSLLSMDDETHVKLIKFFEGAVITATAEIQRMKPQNVRLDYVRHSWANVADKHGFNVTHVHSNCSWSASYYVSCPMTREEDPLEGVISFEDPRGYTTIHGLNATPLHTHVRPQEGMLVLFPSWLRHSVYPHNADEPRISIALNAIIRNVGDNSKTD